MIGCEVNCACRRGDQSCFDMLRSVGCVGDFVSRIGAHPTIGEVADEIVKVTGTYLIDEDWRVGLAPNSVVVYKDPRRSSGSFNLAVRILIEENLLYAGLRITGSADCSVAYDDVHPGMDGYCYLSLYPQAQWVSLAASCGSWPMLGALPSGRFPAVAKRVVADFAAAFALHCEPAVCETCPDELTRYPDVACVGGGHSDVACAFTDDTPLSVVRACSACEVPPSLHYRLPRVACACARVSQPTVADLHRERKAVRYKTDGRLTGNCVFVRDAFPSDWGPTPTCGYACASPGEVTAFPCHGGATDPDCTSVVSVDAEHWMMHFPKGSLVVFGNYRFVCNLPLALAGSGKASIQCRVSGSWVLGRGLTAAMRDRYLHFSFGCDPTDGTARMTSALACQVYYISSAWAVPLEDVGSVSDLGRVAPGLDGAFRQVDVPMGRYGFSPGYAGNVIKSDVGMVGVGDLVLSGSASVCVMSSYALRRLSVEVRVRLLVGCDARGRLPDALERYYALDALRRMGGFTGGRHKQVPAVDASVVARVFEVQDCLALDAGGPSSDEEGGYSYGKEFD